MPHTDAETVWYRLGYALEQNRRGTVRERLEGLAERGLSHGRSSTRYDAPPGRRRPGDARDGPTSGDEASDALVAAGAGAVLARVLGLWKPRWRPGVLGLLRGAAAGAGAAVLGELLRPVIHGQVRVPAWGDALTEASLAGAARGVVYATAVAPRLPGPALFRGAVFGVAEHAISPWGGLSGLLGRHASRGSLPFLAGFFEEFAGKDDTLGDHLAFAMALAVLYGTGSDDGDEG